MSKEIPFTFICEGRHLIGLLHQPGAPSATGVLIIVGGPQYRAGSHRQFTLMARALSDAGVPSMRFDYRGMGDSDGEFKGFESIHDDIHAALDAFFARQPGLEKVVLWGLCDAASAALFYAHQDPRVAGIVLLNPWVRTEQGEAKAFLKHYYLQRLFSRSFWGKLLSGRFAAGAAWRSFIAMVKQSKGGNTVEQSAGEKGTGNTGEAQSPASAPLPDRMLAGWRQFKGAICLILSGDDLTAAEFSDTVAASRPWRRELAKSRVTQHKLNAANHTFASRQWRRQVETWTVEWVKTQMP